MVRHALVPVVLCLLACNGSGNDGSGFSMAGGATASSPASTGAGSSTSTSTGTVEDSTAAAASSTSGGPGSSSTSGQIPDQGTMPDFGGESGCKGKIDFLFAISADWSMEDAQERLKDSFEGFID